MADINVQSIGITGLTPVYTAAAAAGDALQLGDGFFVHYKNGSAAAITVTLITPGTVSGLAVADRALTVPAGGDLMVKLDRRQYEDPVTGRAMATYSGVTTLSVAVLTS